MKLRETELSINNSPEDIAYIASSLDGLPGIIKAIYDANDALLQEKK